MFGVDDGALAQRQPTVAHRAIDHGRNSHLQLAPLQQSTEMEDGGFFRDTFQVQPRKQAWGSGLVQYLLDRGIAVVKPIRQQMHVHHRNPRISWLTIFTVEVVRLDQRSQAPSRCDLIHLGQDGSLLVAHALW